MRDPMRAEDFTECGDSPASVVPQADAAMDMWSTEAQKKRKGDVSQWGRNVAKKRATLVRSTSVTKASKRVVGAKTVSPACNCPKKCFDRVSVENVKCIFNEYWNIKELFLIMNLTVSS